MAYELVIRNGTIVDGSGRPPYRGDVAVSGDRISEIGKISAKATTEIDAEGRLVTPGFIDGHTHMDAQVFWDALGSCSCWHGVTSVVMGNCGFTLAPARTAERELVLSNLERAEDISAAAMAAGIEWRWESFNEYLDAVEAEPKAINYAAQIGHSALRTFAMGERAFSEEASEDDLEVMERTLREALRAGAVGFTTSISSNHMTMDGRPVASRLASWDEICRLVGVLGVEGGVFELAMKDEASRSYDPEVAMVGYRRLKDLSIASGAPITFGIRAADVEMQLDFLDETAAAGGEIFGQSRSLGTSVVYSFKSGLPYDLLPVWKEFRTLPHKDQLRQLHDSDLRSRLVAEVDAAYERGGETGMVGAKRVLVPFGSLLVLRVGRPETTVADLAGERGVPPAELIIDLALETQLEQVFGAYKGWNDDDLLLAMKHPRNVMTFSDSGAHVSYHSGAELHTTLLAKWVRELEAFSIEEAVRMITFVPARRWQMTDRGIVREGKIADLNVIDLNEIALAVPTVEADLPAGATRVKQKANGITATVVSGKPTFLAGEHTGEYPGHLLRRPQPAR